MALTSIAIKKIPLKNNGTRIEEDEACITDGYNDKYKYFIHTVAPYYDSNNMMKYNIMEKCFNSIFLLVKNHNILSLTIPALGTGFYGFHMYDFTIICFQKIIEYLEKNKDIKKITLITNSKLQYNYFYIIYSKFIHQI